MARLSGASVPLWDSSFVGDCRDSWLPGVQVKGFELGFRFRVSGVVGFKGFGI